MKKLQLGVSPLVCLSLLLALSACSPPGGSEGVDFVPVIWANPIAGSKAISVAPGSKSEQAEFECSFGPIITSFQSGASAGGLGIGDSFTSDVFGGTVTTTISASGSDIIYTGTYDADGLNLSKYVLTLHSDNTFDFEQTIVYDMGGGFMILGLVKIDAGTVFTDGSYSGPGTGYVYYYNYPGDGPGTARYAITTADIVSKPGFFGMRTIDSTAPDGIFDEFIDTVVIPDSESNATQIVSALLSIDTSDKGPYDFITFHNEVNGWARAGGTDTYDFLSDTTQYGRNIQDLAAAASYHGLSDQTDLTGAQYIAYVWDTYAQ